MVEKEISYVINDDDIKAIAGLVVIKVVLASLTKDESLSSPDGLTKCIKEMLEARTADGK